MIEFDMNSKRDLELKSEYDEMASMFKEKEQKLKEREENLNKQLKEQLKHQETIIKEKEHNNQIEIAKNLLKLNLTTDNISQQLYLLKKKLTN